MCNLYSITTNQEAIIRLFRKVNRYVGNLAPMPGVFPDYPAPVIRNAGDDRAGACRRHRSSAGLPSPTSATLVEIAKACGFSGQSHLTRAFGQIVGISPGLWRRARRT